MNRDHWLRVRLSKKEHELLENYAKFHNTTVSKVTRQLINTLESYHKFEIRPVEINID